MYNLLSIIQIICEIIGAIVAIVTTMSCIKDHCKNQQPTPEHSLIEKVELLVERERERGEREEREREREEREREEREREEREREREREREEREREEREREEREEREREELITKLPQLWNQYVIATRYREQNNIPHRCTENFC
jgi:hypothetical protein